MNERENRGPWYLITGLILGLAIGLTYAWSFQPVQFFDTAPVYLRANFKDEYRALVSVSFLASGNLVRAQQRLSLLQDPDLIAVLSLQAGRWPMEGRPASENQALAALAAMLIENAGKANATDSGVVTGMFTATPTVSPPPPSPTISTPTARATIPSVNSQVTPTLLPTRTPTSTPGGSFVLQEQSLLCDTDPGVPLIVFEIVDAGGNPVPNLEISVTWPGSEERLFTGLKPEFGLGYADFTMTPGERYTVQVQPANAAGSQPLTGLTATECEANGKRFWGVWKLIFKQN